MPIANEPTAVHNDVTTSTKDVRRNIRAKRAARPLSRTSSPFSNRTKHDQAKLDAAVLRALERCTVTIGCGTSRRYGYMSRMDIAICITVGIMGVTVAMIDQLCPMVSASCKRLLADGLIVEGARKYARKGLPA